jgi:S-DNA-T family DNA segregation ATPase FtsK/SpoIIIE
MILPATTPRAPAVPAVSAAAAAAASLPASVNGGANVRALQAPIAPRNTRMPTVLGRGAAAYGRTREVAALVLWTLSLFLVLALASYQGDPSGAVLPAPTAPGPDWVGPVGAFVARGLVSLVGVVAWGLPLELMLMGIPLVRAKESPATAGRIAGDLLIAVVTAALVQVGSPGRTAFGTHLAGGIVGELFGELARSLFSTAGSFLVGFACLGLILIGRAAFSFIAFARLVARIATQIAAWTASTTRAIRDAWIQARALERERNESERLANEPRIDTSSRDEAIVAALPLDLEEGVLDALVAAEPEAAPKRRARKVPAPRAEDPDDAPVDAVDAVTKQPATRDETPKEPTAKKRGASKDAPRDEDKAADDTAAEAQTDDDRDEDAPISGTVPAADATLAKGDEAAAPVEAEEPARAVPSGRRAKKAPTIVDTSAALEKERADARELREAEKAKPPSTFTLPSIDFLNAEKVEPSLAIDRERLLANAQTLIETLAHYGVQGKVEDILPGPTVTTYEVSPAAGTKVSKVAGLADDLALALARKVRIVAPIPGKNRIGFELPNDKRIKVVLRDLIEDRRFQTLDVPLPVVIGRDILGNPVYADLASMPHVIVAGATGAGKSVGLNVMLLSMLYRRSPDELRLLMIDPKVVELAPFDRIPHMLLPVVTDMKLAATALKWAVDEMERRYQIFADAGTKNIATYNGWVDRVVRGEAKNPNQRVVQSKDFNGFTDEIPAEKGSDEGTVPLPERLPWIVIVVDEFADLMMQQGKEVESAVARLAQKARAAGMHVILATQRPSTDVITGTIKANFPTRIAYRVSQRVDSRTILDEQGAEHLLGMGDMLIRLNGSGDTKRVQCPWVSEDEVQRVTDCLREQGEPVYDDNILKPRDDEAAPDEEADAEQDPLYDDAVRVVAETRRCSTSWLQRKLGLGYNRAARIVEMMERRGLVGPANGAKDREVLVEPV